VRAFLASFVKQIFDASSAFEEICFAVGRTELHLTVDYRSTISSVQNLTPHLRKLHCDPLSFGPVRFANFTPRLLKSRLRHLHLYV